MILFILYRYVCMHVIMISKNIEILHEEVADEAIAIQHDLRLLASQSFLQVFFQLHKEVIALKDTVPTGRKVTHQIGDLPDQEALRLLATLLD